MHLLVQTSLDTGKTKTYFNLDSLQDVPETYLGFYVLWLFCHLCCRYNFILFSSKKIMVTLDSSYFKTYKPTRSSSFYTVYCQRYSNYKTRLPVAAILNFSTKKWTKKIESFFKVKISEKTHNYLKYT